jgi:hypothetical protein
MKREEVMENQNRHGENNDNQNNRRPDNRRRSYNRNHSGQEKKTSVTRIGSGSRNRGPSNGQTAGAKSRDPQKNNDNMGREGSDHRHGRFSRKNNRSHYDHLNRSIRAKREETVDDIRADIDQLEKDIQFEIKQIKSIKLGL